MYPPLDITTVRLHTSILLLGNKAEGGRRKWGETEGERKGDRTHSHIETNKGIGNEESWLMPTAAR